MAQPLFEKELKSLETQRASFNRTSSLSKEQSKWLGKVVALFQELPDRDQLPNTTKMRRETARVNFKQIHDELGCEVFYLCTFSFTITHMGTIKHISELIAEIRSWRADKVLPTQICDEEKCLRIFGGTTQCSAYLQMDTSSRDDHSFHGPPLKRCCTGIDEQRTKQTVSHEYSEGNNDIGEGTGDGDNSDVNNGDDDVSIGAEVDDEDDTGRDEAIQDISLKGRQYQITAMDAIRVLSNFPATPVWLTMPEYPGFTPFITFCCPQKAAVESWKRTGS